MTPDMTLLDVSVTPNQNKEKEKIQQTSYFNYNIM
jgi:hypothetical protein